MTPKSEKKDKNKNTPQNKNAQQQQQTQQQKQGKTPNKGTESGSPQKKVVEGGVIIEELKAGEGPVAKPGKMVS